MSLDVSYNISISYCGLLMVMVAGITSGI